MNYLFKYLTSAPVAATLTLFVLSGIMIELNRFFPGLQFGTLLH